MPNRRTPGPKTLAPISRQNGRGRPFGPSHRGKPFPPGTGGRPKGVRNKTTTMLARMFDDEAERIGRRTIELAQEGRVGAIKLILDRAFPARQGRRIEGMKLPAITSAADAVTAMGAVTAAVTSGAITIDEARDLTVMIDAFRKMHELAEIERRIAALEANAPGAAVPPRADGTGV